MPKTKTTAPQTVELIFPQDPLSLGYNLYADDHIYLRPGITTLVGCNGAGKTTLMRQLMYTIKKQRENAVIVQFNNLTDGGHNAIEEALFLQQNNLGANLLIASEGESIRLNVGQFMKKAGAKMSQTKDAKELWIFLDATDSGLSIDNAVEIKDAMRFIIETEGKRGIDVFAILSTNSYEFARNETCIYVYHPSKTITFKDYEDYRSFILKSSETRQSLYDKKKTDKT